MHTLRHLVPLLSAATMLTPAHADLITNGSFETGPALAASPPFIALTTGSTSITAWTVVAGNIDYGSNGNGFWPASNGSRSIDLNGNTRGAIEQTVATVVGARYEVLFDLAGDVYGAPAIKTVRVSAGGQSADYSFDITGHSANSMGWTTRSFVFTATAGLTPLRFTSVDLGGSPGCSNLFLGPGDACYGAALDNVRMNALSPVPEPRGLALSGAAALALLCAVRRLRDPQPG